MNCAACGHTNPERAKFCLECGTPFAVRCASCGLELPLAAKFCLECGTATAGAPSKPTPPAAADAADMRKVVTIVFADLVGSTALHERLEPESARRFMESYYVAMRGAVEAHGGTVTQLLGDGVKAVFGIPRVAEDDAIRAVRAAVAMQDAFRALAEAQRGAVGATGLRVAVNTGEVVANDETEIIGDPVNVAARLQEQGKDGDVVVGESTHRLVATLVTLELLGSFALKGRSEAVRAYRFLSLERPAGAATAPFVGRDEEIARLTTVYTTAVEKPAAGLAVLLGSPGLGKSRLIDEFARRHADAATVVLANCDAAGGATFAPLAEALRELLGIESSANADALRAAVEAALLAEEADRARIASGIAALLAGSPPSPEETFFVVRRLLGALAQAKPVVLVIDDLHWAEPLLLDLVEHLIQWGSGTALFVLIGARPELRDLRSSLVTPGGLVADVITLAGLDAGAAMRLAANVIGAADLPAAIAAKVLATSEGNPLFVGELVRMLVQEGAITRDGDRWIAGANLAALEMPPTIHALLAARIERLRPEERTLLERAAVVGRHFSRSAIAALLPQSGDLDARLEALRRSELIERDTGWLLGEPVLRFHHVLIRDAAYRRLLKGTRSELHAKLADWIEAKVGDAPEHDETIGWHLEQAHAFLRELGPLDENGKQLGARAATRLAAAGRRALVGDDVPLAASLLGRAIERLDAEDPARADLALDWCEALLSAGDVGPAAAAIAELDRFSANSERLGAWQTCYASQLIVLTAPQGLQAAADAVAAAAQQLTALGDAAGEAKAYSVHAQALARLGKVGACEAALDLALAAARRAGDRRRANAVLAGAPLAALWGPSPVTRASGRCLDVVRVLRITQGAPAVESVALSCQAVLEALRGRTDAARRMIASSRKMVEELGIASRLFEADVFAGRIEAMEGDTEAAERLLRGAYEGLRDLGLGIDAARAGALLARVLLAQDRGAEAEALTHESEALAGDDLQAAIAWRGVRAEALAKRGEHEAATALAQAAVAIASATDALLDHADARMALAAALRAASRAAEADAEERRARELWEAKGATLLAERAQRAPASVAPPVAAPAAVPARTRRVHANAATAVAARVDMAFAAGDLDAFAARMDPSLEFVDHPVGAMYGHAEAMVGIRAQLRAREPRWHQQPIATLGSRLGLFRNFVSARATTGTHFDVGASETVELTLCETDGAGATVQRIEVFGEDKLADAIARLYERHAELLPEGPERERAAAAARSFGFHLLAPGDEERATEVLAPDFESIDHRPLRTWSARSSAAFLDHLRALRAVAADVVISTIDVLALEPAAILTRRMHSGTERVGGGEYERPFLVLFATDAAGRLARAEWFDADREAEALARFDVLTGNAEPAPPVRRRLQANAASAGFARIEAAFAARDATAWEAEFDASLAVIAHPTGASYGRDGHLRSLLRLAQSHDPALHFEPIATLGEHLALARRRVAASGATSARYDVGAYEREEFVLSEVGPDGRTLRIEIFGQDKLDDAAALLYERHAALLPDGPERVRAAATAHTFAMIQGAADVDLARLALVLAPDLEGIDHRHLSLWSFRGAEAYLEHVRGLRQVADEIVLRTSEILALEPGAILRRAMHAGHARAGGGAYERPLVSLIGFDAGGRVGRIEFFDADREADALARFEAIVAAAAPAPIRRRVRSNAATASVERFVVALDARDAGALPTFFDDALRVVHHPSGSTYGRREMLATWRSALRAERLALRRETLATLGDTLVLSRQVAAVAGLRESFLADFGATEIHEISLIETDAGGRWTHVELFAPERLGEAVVRLYERHAELLPDGPERVRAEATARSLAPLAAWSPEDPEVRLGPVLASEFVGLDHRHLSTWSLHGASVYVEHVRALRQVADDIEFRQVDILALTPDAQLMRVLHTGVDRAGGGVYERPFLSLFVFDANGKFARGEWFDADREAEALARFEALSGDGAAAEPPRDPFDNAAACADRLLFEHFNARDWPGIEALAAPDLVFDERRRMLRNSCGRDVWLEQFRVLFEVPASRFTTKLLATRGDRLALSLHRFEGEVAGGGGPLAMDDHLVLHEVDREGRIVAIVLFDLEDEDAAYAELDARLAAGEGAAHRHVLAAWIAMHTTGRQRDWDALAPLHAPDFALRDHRPLGWGTLVKDAATFVRLIRSARELAPDAEYRTHHLRICARGTLARMVLGGTRDGGAFETPFLRVTEMNEQGLMLSADLYDESDFDRALVRFAEIAAPAAQEGRFENSASRAWRRVNRAWTARDLESFTAPHAATLRYRDHRRLFELDLDRQGFLDFTRPLLTMRAGDASLDLVATRGERLALMHSVMRMEDDAVGPSTIESLMMIEVDERGAITAYDRWDLEDVDAAHAELEARFAADPSVAHGRAMADFVRAVAARDWEAVAAFCSRTFVHRDHRSLAVLGTTLDPEAWAQMVRALVEIAPDAIYQAFHVRTATRGFLSVGGWQGSRDGGCFEIPQVAITEVDARGAWTRVDVYEPEQLDRALARWAEIDAPARAAGAFENAASAIMEPIIAAVVANDWARYEALYTETARCFDRRRMVQLDFDRAAQVAFARELADGRRTRGTSETLATRGERLALVRGTFEFEDADAGPSEIVSLLVTEVDERGRIVAYVRFDDDDVNAAYAELDARFDDGEGAAHARTLAAWRRREHAMAIRDWDAFNAMRSPGFVFRDHRLLGFGTMSDGASLDQLVPALVDLAPDVRRRHDHIRLCERGILEHLAQFGTRDGGAFEHVFLAVYEWDAQGRSAAIDNYDVDRFDLARARFEELAVLAEPTPLRFENAASRAWRVAIDAWRARDVARFEATQPRLLRYRDHRRLFQLDLDRQGFLDFTRPLLTMRKGSAAIELVATRGERLALMRFTMTVEDETVGPSAIDSLLLIETDERGEIAAYDRWDLEDEDAAYTELDARWDTGEGAAHPAQVAFRRDFDAALARRNWDALAACYAPDFVGEDHRLVSWGTLRGPAFAAGFRTMIELAPDARMRWDHLRVSGRVLIAETILLGTRDGGAFESPFVLVGLLGAHGKAVQTDFYDPHHLDRALARFEELRASEPHDPLPASVMPNLATAAMARNWAVFDVLDLDAAQEALDAARAQYAPDFVWDDRRPLVGLSGDLDLMVASARERLASGARHERRTLVGTAGDRVAIGRVLWAGGPADGRFEVEFLVVTEVNEAGLFTAHVFFEPDDTRAAQREAWARWAAIDPAVAPWVELLNEITDAWNAHDAARLRAIVGDDFVIEDHRLADIGRIEGAAAYVDTNAVLWDLAPDQRAEFGSSFHAYDRHGVVATMRRVGTLPDGGAFESDYVWLGLARDGRITRLEFFEVEQRDAALARFEALRPDSPSVPPSTATRMRDRHRDAFVARDWDAIRAVTAADFIYEDRGKRALVRGDVEAWIGSMEFTTQPGFRTETALIGTLGDRIVFDQVRWFGKPGGDAFEFERLRLLEVGADGMLRAVLFFDPEDRFAATVEGLARFATGEAAGSAGIAPLVALFRALCDRSWEAVRACLAPDFILVDHRPLSFGTLDRDAWIASMQAADELGDGVIWEVFRVLAWSEQGFVVAVRRFGTIADGGGPFEVDAILTALVVEGRIQRGEIFGEADAECAVARFEALCAGTGR